MVCGDVIRICCGRIQRDNNGGCVLGLGVGRPSRVPLYRPFLSPYAFRFRSVREVQLHLLPGRHRGLARQVHRVPRIRPLLAGGSTVRTTILDHVIASPAPSFLDLFLFLLSFSHTSSHCSFRPLIFSILLVSAPTHVSLYFHVFRLHFSPSPLLLLLFYSRTHE